MSEHKTKSEAQRLIDREAYERGKAAVLLRKQAEREAMALARANYAERVKVGKPRPPMIPRTDKELAAAKKRDAVRGMHAAVIAWLVTPLPPRSKDGVRDQDAARERNRARRERRSRD